MFRIFVIIGGLIAALLLTAFIAPFFIDWSQYRTNFEQQASRIIGHQVTVKGKASARILPFPSLTFNEVEVRDEGDDTALLSVKKFSIFAELAPLLSGELHIINMVLDEPIANANFNINQQLNWTARSNDISAFNVSVDDIVLKNITIKNATIQIEDQTNQHQHQLIGINATLSARSLLGPWHAEGDAIYNANELVEPLKFRMDTGAWSQVEKLMRLRLNIKPQNHPYQFKTVGILNGTQPHLQYDGTFQYDALNNTALKDFATSNPNAGTPLPISLKGDLTVKPSKILLPKFDLDIQTLNEPYRINGNATVSLEQNPRFKITAQGRQVDIQRLKLELNATVTKTEPNDISFSDHLSNLQNFLKQIPHAPIPGEISISLPALTAGDSIIRNLKLDFSQQDDGWDIIQFQADLPGRTKMRANGKLAFEELLNFQGNMIVASSQPTGLANWIKGRIDPQIRPLKKAGFAANVSLNDTLMRFDDLEVDVNGQILKGNIVRTAAVNDDRPSIRADLRGGTLDVNAMLAIISMFTKESQGKNALDHDITLDLENDTVVFENYKAKDVKAELFLSQKNIDIKTLKITDFIGTNLEIHGKVDDIFTSPDGQLSAHLKSENANRFLTFVDQNAPSPLLNAIIKNPALSQDADLNFELDAESKSGLSDIKLDVKGMMAQTQIASNFAFTGDVQSPYDAQIELTSILQQNQPYILLQQLGLNVLPVDLDLPAALEINLKGVAKNGINTQAELNIQNDFAKFNGTVFVENNTEPNLKGKIILEVLDLQDLAFLSGLGIDDIEMLTNNGDETTKAVVISANADGTSNQMTFAEISGKIYGNKLAGNLTVERSKINKPVLSGNLNVAQLSLPLLANWVYSPTTSDELKTSANPFDVLVNQNSWSQASFGDPFLQDLDGSISLTAKDIDLGGNESASLLNTDLILSKGDIALKNAELLWRDQSISFNLTMKNANKAGALRLSLNAQKMPMAKIFWQNTALKKSVIDGTSNIKLNVETSGNSAKKMIKGLSGTAQINMSEGTLNNLNSTLLTDIFPIVDEDGFTIDATSITDVTSQLIYKTPYHFKMKPIEFTFAGGVARTSAINLKDGNSTFLGDVKFDLLNASISGNATLRINPRKDRIEGSSPDVDFAINGTVHAPNITMDATPLSNFLALRAFEIQRYRIEALQAEILEKQRLNRTILKTVTKAEERRRLEQMRLEAEAHKKEQARINLQKENAKNSETAQPIIINPLPKLNGSKKAQSNIDPVEERRRKLKKLQLKYDKEIRNRDGIEMKDLELDGGFGDTPNLEQENQELLEKILNR